MDESTIKKLLGLKIKQFRRSLKLTQFELGEKIGIDQRQVAYIEGGNSFPTLKTLNKFSNFFNCQIKDFFDYENLPVKKNLKLEILDKISNMNEKDLNMCYQLINVVNNLPS